MTGLSRPEAQNLLGKFLFSGWDEHEKAVSVLSGGERRRLALAVTVASGANFLVLDEPTNHLDLESREALEAALEAFPGTVLLVSHDRALLDAISERTLAIEGSELHSYEGGWAEMLRRRDERATRAAAPPEPKPEKKAKPAKPRAKRPSELERLEAEIAAREPRSPISSRSWPRIGRTSKCSRHTNRAATRCKGCSPVGSSSSSRRLPKDCDQVALQPGCGFSQCLLEAHA